MQLSRRSFVAALLASAVPALPAIAAAPAVDMATLTLAARALFPHAGRHDAIYARIASAAVAGPADPAPFVAAAQALAGPAAGMADRIAVHFALPGIQMLRIATLIGLYSDLAVVRRFGYPGPSAEFGGYLHRGFNDLKWLPEPGGAWAP